MALSHLLDQVQAVTSPKREIDDHQVGSALRNGRERLPAGGGFPADGQVGLGVDQGGQAAAKRGVVVDDEDRLLGRARSFGLLCGHGEASQGSSRVPGSGKTQVTAVPRGVRRRTSSEPPIRRAR